MAKKVCSVRMFEKDKSWDSSLKDLNLELLVVSNFTLYGILKKGNKPDFHQALDA